MNELKFNSQICTTKIQSQRLLDLGLKPETADMGCITCPVLIGSGRCFKKSDKKFEQ